MKTVKDTLLRFISLIHLTGAVELKECLIEGTKQALKVCAVTPSKTFALNAKLKGDYSDLGTMGIDDLYLLEKSISLMEDITLTKKENKLTLKDKTVKNNLLLRSPQYIMTKLEEERYIKATKDSRGNEFTLTKDDIKKIADYYDIYKSSVEIQGEDNEIVMKMTKEENSAELKIKVKEKVKSFQVLVAGLFVEALKNINTDVTVSIKTGKPVLLSTKTDDYEVEYFIALLIKEEK